MPKVLIAYHSSSGNTARLAESIAEGARSVEFTEVDIRRIPAEGDSEGNDAGAASRHRPLGKVHELTHYDAIVLGAPAYHGGMSGALKHLLDSTGDWWREGQLTDRVGSAFTTVATPHGGHETTLWSIMTAMANLGMILVPPGFTDPAMFRGGSPYGATATTSGDIRDEDLAAARHQGRRVATVAEWVRHAKGHAAGGHHHHHHH